MTSTTITPDSLALFLGLADDAGDWSGTPLISISAAERGNLTDLKRRGLLGTFEDEGCSFAIFTPLGIDLAREHGRDLSWTS